MTRTLKVVAAILLAIVAVAGVILFFQARDDSTLGQDDANAPGQAAPDATGRTLEQGNVVFLFSDPGDREALRALATEISGPPDEALRHAGQAIIVQRGDALGAQAYKRRVVVTSPDDPALREFADYWLGRGSMP